MYYGQFENPKVDEYIHNRFFSHNPRGLVCMEAGAEEGMLIPTCRFFETSLAWTCINVEPNPPLFNKLINNRRTSTNLNYALVSTQLSRTKVLFQGYHVGLGYVIDETAPEHVKFTEGFAGDVHRKSRIEVVTGISYPDLIAELGLKELALLVLDTEGSELKILESFSSNTVLPSVLCVEDNLGEKDKFDSILLSLGYKFDAKVYVNLHYYRE